MSFPLLVWQLLLQNHCSSTQAGRHVWWNWQFKSVLRQASQRFLISHLHTATIFHIEICQVQAGLDMLSATFTLRSRMSRDSALYVFITEHPMVNLKGLYNIMQLSRCLLTHYRRTHQRQLEFLLPNVVFFSSENGFPILLVTIWPSEHLIESVITQNIAISSYMDPQNWNLSRKKLDLQIFC